MVAAGTTRLIEADLVILDELGYLPFSQVGGALLLHLIGKRYRHTSLAITTETVGLPQPPQHFVLSKI